MEQCLLIPVILLWWCIPTPLIIKCYSLCPLGYLLIRLKFSSKGTFCRAGLVNRNCLNLVLLNHQQELKLLPCLMALCIHHTPFCVLSADSPFDTRDYSVLVCVQTGKQLVRDPWLGKQL